MHLVSMTIRLACALRSSFKRSFCAGLIALALAPLTLFAQTPSAPPDSARTLLAPPPSVAPQSTTATNAVSAPSGYVLSANDQVAVEVFGEDDLRTNGRLNAEGNLSLPLLGSVHLAGLNLTQATSRVTELYARDYLVNPKVNVMLVSYAKRRFTILGQVNRPGSFEMPDGSPMGIDLLEAVAMAGGYTRIAAPERITVRRRGANGDEILKIDGKRLARGASGANSSFKVQPGDTITVGESIF
ncbi:MAG: polysaccharide biosynthesis/export protein VpsN [Verrucomicrobiota bacterium]